MALITDKKTAEKLNDRLNEFSKFGMTIYYLLENERLELETIRDIFFSEDEDKAVVMYLKMMKSIRPNDINLAYVKYMDLNPNTDSIDDSKYTEYLNILYTSKIINEVACSNNLNVDKTYVNTYNYLIENDFNGRLVLENR